MRFQFLFPTLFFHWFDFFSSAIVMNLKELYRRAQTMAQIDPIWRYLSYSPVLSISYHDNMTPPVFIESVTFRQ